MFFMSEVELSSRFKDVVEPINYLKEIIQDENISLAEYSLLFVSSLDAVSKIIIGIESFEQLVKNINTLNKKVNEDIFIDALSLNFDDEFILNPRLWK